MVDVSMTGLADTVENTDKHSANTIKIAILFFMVASLVKAPDNIVAIKIPIFKLKIDLTLFVPYYYIEIYTNINYQFSLFFSQKHYFFFGNYSSARGNLY
jgi:hypothetical protein